MKNADVIDLLPVETEVLTPREFLRLTKENPAVVKASRIVAGNLGSKDFGGIEVTYTRPIYKNLIIK